jgi:hypothetical protein
MSCSLSLLNDVVNNKPSTHISCDLQNMISNLLLLSGEGEDRFYLE